MIMIESEGITENVKSWMTDAISALTSALPNEKIMCVFVESRALSDGGLNLVRFEAAEPEVFTYHIPNQGARANLFVDHSQVKLLLPPGTTPYSHRSPLRQIVQLACLRRGIWGTGSTFGKIVTFGPN